MENQPLRVEEGRDGDLLGAMQRVACNAHLCVFKTRPVGVGHNGPCHCLDCLPRGQRSVIQRALRRIKEAAADGDHARAG